MSSYMQPNSRTPNADRFRSPALRPTGMRPRPYPRPAVGAAAAVGAAQAVGLGCDCGDARILVRRARYAGVRVSLDAAGWRRNDGAGYASVISTASDGGHGGGLYGKRGMKEEMKDMG